MADGRPHGGASDGAVLGGRQCTICELASPIPSIIPCTHWDPARVVRASALARVGVPCSCAASS
eukprot:6242315-Prymnesium_polylepis.1